MNNIYVDELPKKGACLDGCPYAVTDTWVSYCPFQQEENGDHLIVEEDCIKTCPLKSLKDALAEERKKVVQEIGQQLGLIIDGQKRVCCDGDMTGDKTIMAVLDQIERGE